MDRDIQQAEDILSPKVVRHRKKLRTRPITACVNCQKHKIRCNQALPCSNCIRRGGEHLCRFLGAAVAVSHSHKNEIERPNPVGGAIQAFETETTSTSLVSIATDVQRQARAIGLSAPHLRNYEPESRLRQWPNIVRVSSPSTLALSPALPPSKGDPQHIRRSSIPQMSEALTHCPQDEIVDGLINHFFREIQGYRYYLHENTFRLELDQFKMLRQLNTADLVDPAWFTVLIAVMWKACIGLLDSPSDDVPLLGGTLEIHSLINDLYSTLESTLVCAAWLHRPQFRVLQALIITIPINLAGPYTGFVSGFEHRWNRCMLYDVAVGIARGLKLHIDVRGASKHPLLDDPAMPPNLPMYLEEISRRAFHSLLFHDTVTRCILPVGERRFHPSAFPQNSYSTNPPANYTEQSLMWTYASLPESDVAKTAIIWEIYLNRMALHMVRVAELEEPSASLSHSTITDHDEALERDRQHLQDLRQSHHLSEKETIDWLLINSSFVARRLRLLRPFLSRTEPRTGRGLCRSFRAQAFVAANEVLKTHNELIQTARGRYMYSQSSYLTQHHLLADAILFVHAALDAGGRAEVIALLVQGSTEFEYLEESYGSHCELFRQTARVIRILRQTLEDAADRRIEDVDLALRSVLEQACSPSARVSCEGPRQSQPAQDVNIVFRRSNLPRNDEAPTSGILEEIVHPHAAGGASTLDWSEMVRSSWGI